MTTQIGWNDGTGDKIYLSYSASEGNQTVTITSDAYTGATYRTKDVTFSITVGGATISRVLTVRQSLNSMITIITRNDTAITANDTAVGYAGINE